MCTAHTNWMCSFSTSHYTQFWSQATNFKNQIFVNGFFFLNAAYNSFTLHKIFAWINLRDFREFWFAHFHEILSTQNCLGIFAKFCPRKIFTIAIFMINPMEMKAIRRKTGRLAKFCPGKFPIFVSWNFADAKINPLRVISNGMSENLITSFKFEMSASQ